MKELLSLFILALFMTCVVSIPVLAKTTAKPSIRVIGGKKDDYKDSKGRIWYGGLQKLNIKVFIN